MTTYRVEPDGDGTPTLWRAKDDNDPRPAPLAWLDVSGNTHAWATGADGGVVFRAAAAVLAPPDALILAMAEAMFTESGGGSWHALSLVNKDHWIGSAYAALRTLRQHAEGGAS